MNTKIVKKIILKPASLFGLLVLASLVLAACASSGSGTPGSYGNPGAYGNSGSSSSTAVSTQPSSSSSGSASGEATINVVNDPKLGQILVGANGMTLYVFDKDTADKSTCSAGCLALWPPLLTQGHPTLGTGVDQSMIGTTMTTDGRTMVTYNHRPLYYYSKDTNPGDTNGQGIGSVWFVIGPDGNQITK